MLDIDIENSKGILYVRLNGELCKSTINKWNCDVKKIMVDAGIRNVIFNMSNLSDIDYKGINSLYYGYEICRENHGKSILCGINDNIREKIKKSRLLKYMKESDTEKHAASMIRI